MKNFTKILLFTFLALGFVSSTMAATTPNLGTAASFAILSETFVNTVAGTIINGDLGYTTAPAMNPTINGVLHNTADAAYTAAGINQAAALANLIGQSPCTDISALLPLDAVVIGTNPPGTFPPGCYFSAGAMNITASTTVTLSGAGTYIFRPGGALNTAANTNVVLTNGATSCDVFWTPNGATNFGDVTHFIGTIIPVALQTITVGDNTTWIGRALNFGASTQVIVSVGNLTITTPTCTVVPTPSGGGGATLSIDVCLSGDYSPSYYDRLCGTGSIAVTGTVQTGAIQTGTIATGTAVITTPGFPKTGILSERRTFPWNSIIFVSFVITITSLIVALKKRTI